MSGFPRALILSNDQTPISRNIKIYTIPPPKMDPVIIIHTCEDKDFKRMTAKTMKPEAINV
jgi:hypothetical protein